MTSNMTVTKRVSQGLLFVLWGVALYVSSRSSILVTADNADHLVRRASDRQVRGSHRDLGIGTRPLKYPKEGKGPGKSEGKGPGKSEGKGPEKSTKQSGISSTRKKTRNGLKLPGVTRPLPKVFDNLALKDSSSIPVGGGEKELPEQQQQDTSIKVNKKGVSTGPIIPDGTEHFQQVDVEVYKRQVPAFTIQFEVDDSMASIDPTTGDYDEFSDVSEEYLDDFLSSVFADVPVGHQGTILNVLVNDTLPYTVDFLITLEFIIPGEVPTINFLIDQLQEGLETDTSTAFYISKLSTMNEANPFSKIVSYKVISRPPLSAAEMVTGGRGKPPQITAVEGKSKRNILVGILTSTGCVVLIGAALMWRKRKSSRAELNDPDTNSSTVYGAEKETVSYLRTLRKRYKDNVESKFSRDNDDRDTSEQEVSFDDAGDDAGVNKRKGLKYLDAVEC